MTYRNLIYLFISLICISSSSPIFAKKPFDMAKGVPTQVWPGKHGLNTHIAELDTRGASEGSEFLIIDLPDGSIVDLQRDNFKKRGKGKNAVWIGKAVGYPDSRAVLTIKKGIMFGRLRIDENVYEIRIRANEYNNGVVADKRKNYIVEQLNLDSFPENDEDSISITESDVFIADAQTDSDWTATPAADADATVIIDLMSLYTPATRSAAGGVTNIEATIQAAVDVTNAAFADSGMNVRYRLVHMAESSYDESSSSINSDLDWIVHDTGVAALRDQYGADMVSLIIENGANYCGLGYIQRSPGSWFSPYAFQVTDRGCAVGNLTFAHEHGHNMGFEHNPENSSASPSSASYKWSFGHYTSRYRTVMTYGSVCSNCTRVGLFSDPDISYLEEWTGLFEERDNARTGNATAPIIAAYRPTVIPFGNNAPVFNQDTITADSVEADQTVVGSLAGTANDADGDQLTYSKTSGPAWLTIAANGDLTGTPNVADEGMNSFVVQVTDGEDSDNATLNIEVTLPASAIPVELIIDNTDSNTSYTGAWRRSSGINPWDSDSLYSSSGSTFRWNANISSTGTYAVYAWWTYYSNRSTAAPYTIQHDGGTNIVSVNQRDQSLGGKWVYLGEYSFSAGSAAFVELSSESANGTASADAVKLVSATANSSVNNAPIFNQAPIAVASVEADQNVVGSLAGTASDADGDQLTYSKTSGPDWLTIAANGELTGTPSIADEGINSFVVQVTDGEDSDNATLNIEVTLPASAISVELIIDNTDSNTSYTGAWRRSSGINPWDSDSLYSTSGSTFRWNANISSTGTYAVYAWWTYYSNRSTAAPYTIQHDGGTNIVSVNQRDQSLGGKWVYLGEYSFSAGSAAFVELSSESANGTASADAVKLVKN